MSIQEQALRAQIKDLEWQLQEVLEDNDYYQAENEKLENENAELRKEVDEVKLKSGYSVYLEDKIVIDKAKELLSFWVNDFYDNFNCSNKYEERHKALIETEQFLKDLLK